MSPGQRGGERSDLGVGCTGSLEWHAEKAATRPGMATTSLRTGSVSQRIVCETYTNPPPEGARRSNLNLSARVGPILRSYCTATLVLRQGHGDSCTNHHAAITSERGTGGATVPIEIGFSMATERIFE